MERIDEAGVWKLTEEECWNLLARRELGRLALTGPTGPEIFPVNYVVDGPPTRSEATVGGEPATEFNYPIRVRKGDPPSKVTYWVVRHGTRLFLIRVAYPAKALVADEPVARAVVEGWSFL